MDHRVERLRTPAECESFAKNAIDRKRPDLALAARRKAVEMLASAHETESPLEAEALAAVYAHEALLTRRNGKKTRATGTWQAIKRYGIVGAVQRAVNRPAEAASYDALLEMGMEDWAFEAVILRHTAAFSDEAVAKAKARLAELSTH
jgi:hypothetical protein